MLTFIFVLSAVLFLFQSVMVFIGVIEEEAVSKRYGGIIVGMIVMFMTLLNVLGAYSVN